MIKFIKRLIFSWRYKHAVKQANKFSKLFGMKYMVLFWNGEFKVVPKKNLRALVHAHCFRKGVTLADIEKRAVYVTK